MPTARPRTPFPGYLRPAPYASRGSRSLRWLVGLGGASVLVYLLLLGDSGLLTLHRQRSEVARLRADLARLEEQQRRLHRELQEFQETGSFGLERVARERYGMVAPRERVIHVVEPGREEPGLRHP